MNRINTDQMELKCGRRNVLARAFDLYQYPGLYTADPLFLRASDPVARRPLRP